MGYVKNGSGLYIPSPENIFNPIQFSVTDGTGYVTRTRCKETGFTTNFDKLIFAPASSLWAQTQTFWNPVPYHWETTSNGTCNAYSTSLPILGDQWVFVNV